MRPGLRRTPGLARPAPVLSLALSLACTLAPACAGLRASAPPDWVAGTPTAYPDDAWVTASASGGSSASARGNARAELARVFHARVESEVRDRSASTTTSRATGPKNEELLERLEVDTRVTTEADFEGARIAELWQDPHANRWYALAVVEKSELRASLAVEIAEAARRVSGDLERAEAAPTPLGAARALLDAVRASRQRDVLVARARVAGAGPDAFRPTRAEIERRLGEVLWTTRVQVRALEVDAASGSPLGDLPQLREAFEKRITRIGFRVSRSGEGADLVLTSRMQLEEVPRDFAAHFVRWEGSYELTGPSPDGVVVLSSQGSGGESYATLPIARTRALAKGAQQLANDLQRQISRYLEEPGDH